MKRTRQATQTTLPPNPNRASQTEMNRIAIDNALASEDELIPSSGFLASVMERVREEAEAAAPPPIPFPWKRFLPAFLMAAAVLGWGAFELIRHASLVFSGPALPALHLTAAQTRPIQSAGWVALALALSLLSWLFARRLAGRSGLL